MIIGPYRDYYEYDKGNGDKRPLDMFLNPIMDERGGGLPSIYTNIISKIFVNISYRSGQTF